MLIDLASVVYHFSCTKRIINMTLRLQQLSIATSVIIELHLLSQHMEQDKRQCRETVLAGLLEGASRRAPDPVTILPFTVHRSPFPATERRSREEAL
jgi:hypothetical protein